MEQTCELPYDANTVTDFDPPYDDHDRKTLITILSRKDAIIGQQSEDLARLNIELKRLKKETEVLYEEVEKLKSDSNGCIGGLPSLTSSSLPLEKSTHADAEYGDKPMPDWNTSANIDNSLSISDVVRATAEAELQRREPETDSENLIDSHDGGGTNSDYVYDASSGYYYHPPTGYYWDPNSGLFYDYTTCTYYQYNEANGEYEVHSQVDTESQSISSEKTKRTKKLISKLSKSSYEKTLNSLKNKKSSRKKLKKRLSRKSQSQSMKLKNDNVKNSMEDENMKDIEDGTQMKLNDCSEVLSDGESSDSLGTDESELVSDPESGEIISSSSNSSDVEIIEEEMPYQSEVPLQSDIPEVYSSEQQLYEEAMAENYPPCIRAIVQESDKLPSGTLFIITCAGGSIGRDASRKHCLEIPDLGVSKNHARIDYDYDDLLYKVTDLGSQNGTWVCGKRVHKNVQHPVTHEDVLELGLATRLLCHIHKGSETCEECEPGQVQAKLKAMNPVKNDHVVMSKEERRQHQKKELKKIKKKYGLQNSYFENEGASVNDPNYTDKAHLRRKFVGSENDNAKPNSGQPASVHCPIAPSNKGHKLLAKMGWKEGQGLGKTNDGISEPINVELRVNQSSGLGSGEGHSVSLDHVHNSGKAKRWTQARKRFNELQTSSASQSQMPPSTSTTQGAEMTKGSLQSPNVQSNFNAQRDIDMKTVPSSALSSPSSLSSTPSSSSLSNAVSISKPKPQIKWHKGATETLSDSGGGGVNKDS